MFGATNHRKDWKSKLWTRIENQKNRMKCIHTYLERASERERERWMKIAKPWARKREIIMNEGNSETLD
jgi:hypothetical protein